MALEISDEFSEGVLEKFKRLVDDVELDDVTLLRFLIARDYDMENAEKMLRQWVKWRNENDVENILRWDVPKYLRKDFPYKITGFDNEGGPIVFVPFGRFNHRQWVDLGCREEILKYTVYLLEDAFQYIKRSHGGRQQATVIFGAENISYYQVAHLPSLKILLEAFKLLEQYYPEVIRRLIVLNAPWLFSIPFNFVKGIISAHTLSKLKVFDSNKSEWMSYLLEIAPKENLPSEYFGDN